MIWIHSLPDSHGPGNTVVPFTQCLCLKWLSRLHDKARPIQIATPMPGALWASHESGVVAKEWAKQNQFEIYRSQGTTLPCLIGNWKGEALYSCSDDWQQRVIDGGLELLYSYLKKNGQSLPDLVIPAFMAYFWPLRVVHVLGKVISKLRLAPRILIAWGELPKLQLAPRYATFDYTDIDNTDIDADFPLLARRPSHVKFEPEVSYCVWMDRDGMQHVEIGSMKEGDPMAWFVLRDAMDSIRRRLLEYLSIMRNREGEILAEITKVDLASVRLVEDIWA